MPGVTNGERMSVTREEERREEDESWEEPTWPLSTINFNARTVRTSGMPSDNTWRTSENISSVILISHSLACPDACPDSRSLVAHIPHAPGACRGRVTRSTPEWKWKFGSPHYLQSYHYQRPGSALTKLLTQTFAHSASVPVSWPDKLHSTAHFGKILTPLVWYFAITGVIFGTCLIWDLPRG